MLPLPKSTPSMHVTLPYWVAEFPLLGQKYMCTTKSHINKQQSWLQWQASPPEYSRQDPTRKVTPNAFSGTVVTRQPAHPDLSQVCRYRTFLFHSSLVAVALFVSQDRSLTVGIWPQELNIPSQCSSASPNNRTEECQRHLSSEDASLVQSTQFVKHHTLGYCFLSLNRN